MFRVTITWKSSKAEREFLFGIHHEQRTNMFPDEISHLAGVIFQVADALHWFDGRRAELVFKDHIVKIENI